jgi:hypothetical protein
MTKPVAYGSASCVSYAFLEWTAVHTIHEVGQKLFSSQRLSDLIPKQWPSYHLEIAFLRVLVRQDFVVW